MTAATKNIPVEPTQSRSRCYAIMAEDAAYSNPGAGNCNDAPSRHHGNGVVSSVSIEGVKATVATGQCQTGARDKESVSTDDLHHHTRVVILPSKSQMNCLPGAQPLNWTLKERSTKKYQNNQSHSSLLHPLVQSPPDSSLTRLRHRWRINAHLLRRRLAYYNPMGEVPRAHPPASKRRFAVCLSHVHHSSSNRLSPFPRKACTHSSSVKLAARSSCITNVCNGHASAASQQLNANGVIDHRGVPELREHCPVRP